MGSQSSKASPSKASPARRGDADSLHNPVASRNLINAQGLAPD
jgi:hypothetical protein